MTIRFDPDQRRSTHVETGLAVEWVRDEPPMERSTYFKLIVDGIEVPFVASYDYGEDKIKKANPDIGALELDRLSTALWEKNYRAVNIKAHFDKQIFVEVWRDWFLKATVAIASRPTTAKFRQLTPTTRPSGSVKDER